MAKSKKRLAHAFKKIKEPDQDRGTIKVVASNEKLREHQSSFSYHTFKMVFLERNYPMQLSNAALKISRPVEIVA